MKRAVADIKVGARIRKGLGDLASLAESLRLRTMLHPVVVTPDGCLIAGLRRLEAAKLLGWPDVPVTVVGSLSEAADLLRAEAEENICRARDEFLVQSLMQRRRRIGADVEALRADLDNINARRAGRGLRPIQMTFDFDAPPDAEEDVA